MRMTLKIFEEPDKVSSRKAYPRGHMLLVRQPISLAALGQITSLTAALVCALASWRVYGGALHPT